jgi:tetratricopeptide (TPR) repeat protein
VPFVPISEAVDAQLTAADALLDEGLAPEAAAAFDSAETLSGASLPPRAVVGQSRALDLTGAHSVADDVRARSIEAALADGDHTTAFRLATSGLPEAEAVDGSEATIAHLVRIDPVALSRRDRWLHASALARQTALQGRLEDSIRWADAAQQLARTRDEKVASALATRSVKSAVTDPVTRLAVLDTVADDVDHVSPDLQAEYLLLRAIDLFEAADTPAALACHERLCAVQPLPALRRWHADLFAAMALADAGDGATASRLRSEALRFATDARFREGESAYLIAEFVDLWLSGHTALLLGMVESGAVDPERAAATRAAVAVVLDAAGRADEALVHAEQAVEAVVAAPVFQGIPALAFAARILARSDRHDLIDAAAGLLSVRGPSMLVLGAGATSLGPVDRYLAHLTHDPDERRHHLTQALEVASRAASPRWMAVTHAELDAL